MAASSVAPSGAALRHSGARTIPVAASTALRGTLTGAPQQATVIGTPAGAVYLRADSGALFAASAPRAARLPMSTVPGDDDALRSRPETGELGQVGGGRIEVGCLSAYVVRWWDPRPALPPVRTALLTSNLELLGPIVEATSGVPADAVTNVLPPLTGALRLGDEDAALQAAEGLIGLGPGLTPAGDDLLVGLLSALVCLAPPRFTDLAARVSAAAKGRTTELSLALLRHASLGNCVGAVGVLLRALAGAGDLLTAHRRLLSIGHSSGPALHFGVVLGADIVARPAAGP